MDIEIAMEAQEARLLAYMATGMTRMDAQDCLEADEALGRWVVVSQNWALQWCVLADQETGRPVRAGDRRVDFRGDDDAIAGGRAPQKPSSAGFVWTEDGREVYPSVFCLEWRVVG